MWWIFFAGLFCGMVIGACFGVVIMGMMVAAGHADDDDARIASKGGR